MSGHNVNIYFQEKIYQKIKPLIAQRKVSEFVNQVVEKELNQREKLKKKQLKQRLITGYQARAKNKKIKKMLQTYGEMSWEDISNELARREKKDVE